MSSVTLDTAARVQVGDGADAISAAVTTSAADITIPKKLRGKFVRMYASAGTAHLSVNTTATTTNGVEVVSGTPEKFYVPTEGVGDFVVSCVGSQALTLKIVVVSP